MEEVNYVIIVLGLAGRNKLAKQPRDQYDRSSSHQHVDTSKEGNLNAITLHRAFVAAITHNSTSQNML